jgi:hypothetical protein
MEQEFIDNELIILTKPTLDKLLAEENPADLISLYTFFYYTAKWQKTNIVKATQGYVKKGLGWGIDRLNKSESKLVELGLIEKITRKDKKGRIIGWFIKVNYIFKKNNVEIIQNTQKPQVDTPTSGNQETNALSTNNINALSTNIESITTNIETTNAVTLPLVKADGTSTGKTNVDRILYLYCKLFYSIYMTNYKPNWGKDKMLIKLMLKNYTEIQLAYMLCVYFTWHGMSGSNSRDYDFVTGATFPIGMFKTMAGKFEIYIRNVLGYKFDDDNEMLSKVGEHLRSIK